jgi:uncharacterized membrane protein YiaA
MNQATTTPASSTFAIASWAAMAVGTIGYLFGLWNAGMGIEEKGYYFVVLAFGMFSAVSIQKSVRDRLEGIPVSNVYYGVSWGAVITAVALIGIGLYNATTIDLSEKGFYAMAYILCIFTAITVQKNTRDQAAVMALGAQPQKSTIM